MLQHLVTGRAAVPRKFGHHSMPQKQNITNVCNWGRQVHFYMPWRELWPSILYRDEFLTARQAPIRTHFARKKSIYITLIGNLSLVYAFCVMGSPCWRFLVYGLLYRVHKFLVIYDFTVPVWCAWVVWCSRKMLVWRLSGRTCPLSWWLRPKPARMEDGGALPAQHVRNNDHEDVNSAYRQYDVLWYCTSCIWSIHNRYIVVI